MNIQNTSSVPLAVFHIRTDGERTSQILEPGQALGIELEPGDSVKTRIATEITDAPAGSGEAATEE